MRGTMLWFNEAKDTGFITTEEGERLLAHGSGFAAGARPHGRCGGVLVDFRVTEGEDGRRAEDVTLVEEAAPRRARMRRYR
ncbi:MAG: cold shock domain-containing protein [Gaiellaceae bacterium]